QETLSSVLGQDYERRVLRVLVQEGLHPIHQFTMSSVVASVYRNILECHHWVCNIPRVLHRNISLDNIMYRETDGKVCGVLNGYDLSIENDSDSRAPSSRHRTGTKPYMATDFLESTPFPPHPYHDFESLIYVIIAHTARYQGGKLMSNPPLQKWFDSDSERLKDIKAGLIWTYPVPDPSPDFQEFRHWTTQMCQALMMGKMDRVRRLSAGWGWLHPNKSEGSATDSAPGSQEETLGGHLRYERLEEIMGKDVGSPVCLR
ncbi:uncharacterized protein EI90DRAFT_2914920, partial [Cantharellus anzutake]|uniref:uncharacterized protein n=1 Tax=Cantharellus anzutake TaxID=1750568 RepID=UPI001903F386